MNLTSMLNECFEENEYFFKAFSIINNANNKSGELHHIVPRSYFKIKGIELINRNNLVLLSPKEHYLVHYYLTKCSKELIFYKMVQAYLFMSSKLISKNIIDKADEYEELKNILNKKIGTKILCLDTCEIFNSKREASRKYNLDRKSLNCVLNEENYSINNLHFEYYNGNSSKEYCLKQLEVLNKRKEANDNRVKIICLDDKQIFNSLADAEREYNIQHAVLSNCINGKYKSANNLHFEKYNKDINYSDTYCIDKINRLEYNRKIKKDDNHKKKILCIEENKLFDSINEALRWLGKSSNGKFNKCLKETNYIYGYHWLFV